MILLSLIFFIGCSSNSDTAEIKRLKQQASHVTIIRDSWGVSHIYGKTDADAVFGLMYAQCEESFERVEKNYLDIMGRNAEIEGKEYLLQDFLMRVIYDSSAAKDEYYKSPPWLKKLLQSFADGINYYLYTHPEVKPIAIKHFEPWFPLMLTDGAYISTNTGGLKTADIKNLYSNHFGKDTSVLNDKTIINNESTGSNAFAIAPSRSASGNAMLYINPHVSFYFRTEVHMISEEGLNAYGAATWGQFFIFQGFNENCGWAHTSSMADAADLYEEKIIQKGKDIFYEYDGQLKPVSEKKIFISYKKDAATLQDSITVYFTNHGPVMGKRNGMWLSLKAQNRSMNQLIQSWQRMKAKNLSDFKNILQIKANASTNTMYADKKGNIAYWHGNFIPKRENEYNWNLPVDGTTSVTEWKGIHKIDEIVHSENPSQGWIQNCNSTPFNASGFSTSNAKSYPLYMAPEGDNFRSLRAIKLIEEEKNFTIEKLIALGYDNYLSMFDSLLPPLFDAYNALPVTDTYFKELKEPIKILQTWDKRSSVSSVATTLAIFWAYQLISVNRLANKNVALNDQVQFINSLAINTSAIQKLKVLYNVILGLKHLYGSWKIPWGDINRYQRNTGTIIQKFDDAIQSEPVGLAPAIFGSLPAYETVWSNTDKQYGVGGNSFVAVIEFGEKINARSIVTGGQSFDSASKHFNDQTQMFINGKFKDVFFYKEDVERNAERKYHPGTKQ